MKLYNPIEIRPQDFVYSIYSERFGRELARVILPFLMAGRPVILDYEETEYTLLLFRIKVTPFFYRGLMDELSKHLPLEYLENMVHFKGLTPFYIEVLNILQHW